MVKLLTKTLPQLFVLLLILSTSGYSQRILEDDPNEVTPKMYKVTEPIVCYTGAALDHSIPFPSNLRNATARQNSTIIEVTYVGFNNRPDAQAAFQYAVDIWAGLIDSPQPIRIRAQFSILDEGVLGSASPAFMIRNFKNAPKVGVNYPIALAEKISNTALNTEEQFDITTSFNSTADWYFDVDNPDDIAGTGKTDFATVVLHELGHGLGFFSATNVDEDTGIGGIGLFQNGTFPTTYTSFVSTTSGDLLVTDIPNNSVPMGDAITGNSLEFDGPTTVARLYAPSEFARGSSFSHLANVYNGTPNSLMTPSIGTGGFNHDPGLSLGIMQDYGWEFTYIEFDPLPSTESFDQDFELITTVTTDVVAGFDTTSLVLHYSKDGFTVQDIVVPMVATGNPGEFKGTIPSDGEGVTYSYFVEVDDKKQRTITNPGVVIIENNIEQVSFQFTADIDDSIPTIDHTPVDFVLDTKTEQAISASIVDYLMGVDTAYVEYLVNDVARTSFGLGKDETTLSIFDGSMDLTGVADGDLVKYRIVAIDSSVAANVATSPETGFHEFNIEGIPDPVTEYKNDFNSPTSDFLGTGFEITTPANFDNGAIHSSHPYEEALDELEINYLYQLKTPIIVASENTEVTFQEIVLVEPGADGSAFGAADFWDFVVTEASTDNGESWFPIIDGYDARDDAAWLTKYNSLVNADKISLAPGDPSLYRERKFDLLDNPDIQSGQSILIRFRLFSDQLAAGWGWAIDDLQIQGETVTSLEDVLTEEVRIYPNPSADGFFTLSGSLKIPSTQMHVEVLDMMGRSVMKDQSGTQGMSFAYDLDLQEKPAGMYIVTLTIDGEQLSRKILKSR